MTLPRGMLRVHGGGRLLVVGPFVVGALIVAAWMVTAQPATASERRGEVDAPGFAATIRRSDAVWLARIGDPATVQRPVAVPAGQPFIRLRWRLTALEPVAGAPAPAATVLLDESDWRGDLAAWRRCKGDLACADREKPSHATQLSRPPRPGERVLVFARRTTDGWEMAAVRAFDAAERAGAAKRAWAAR